MTLREDRLGSRVFACFARAATAAGLAVSLSACASLPFAPEAEPKTEAREPVDRSPEFDFLVGMEHEAANRPLRALAAYQRAASKDPGSAYLQKKVAEQLARVGRVEESIAAAERALEVQPEDEGTRLFLGTLYRLEKDPEGAERVLLGPDGEPLSPEAATLLFSLYADLQRHEDALGMARWLVEQDPDNLRGHLAVASAYERMDQPEQAEATLRAAIEAHPESLALYATLARLYRAQGDLEAEAEVFREALRHHPDHHGTLVALAQTQVDLGDLEGARETLNEVQRLYPGDLRSLRRLGLLELRAKNYEAAAEHFERVLEASQSRRSGVAYFLGLALRGAADEEGALGAFRRVPEQHERYVDARIQIAGIYERRGEYEQALAEVREARSRLDSRQLDLYEASLRTKAGDFEGAVAFLEDLREEAPDDIELLYSLGVVYGEAGRIDESLRIMHEVLERNPDHAGALNYIGYTWAEQGRNLDQAEAMIVRALELRPDDGYITDSLGWVYYMKARPLLEAGNLEQGRQLLERAVRELERAAELTGGDPVIAEHLGDAYRLLDDPRRALEMYEEALSLGPRPQEQPDLREKLERLRQELGAP